MNIAKKELRNQMFGVLKSLSSERRQEAKHDLALIVEELVTDTKPNNIAWFLPLPDEIDLTPAITPFVDKIPCYIPVCLPTENLRKLGWWQYDKNTELNKGKYGNLEPNIAISNNSPQIITDIVFDLIFLPCVAIDENGNRLGRGQGFYDQYLTAYPPITSVGVAFHEQLVPQVPKEDHDQICDLVIVA